MSTVTSPSPPPAPRPPPQGSHQPSGGDSNGDNHRSNSTNPRRFSRGTGASSSSLFEEQNNAKDSSLPSAVVAAPNPSGLQDVVFYNNVAKEFPDGSAPVLSSLLHSHRAVVHTEMSADVQLAEVRERVEHFRTVMQEKAARDASIQNVELKQEQQESQKDLMRRDVEHGHAWRRMEELVSQMEKRIEADLCSDSATASQFSDAWQELSRRRETLHENLQEAYRALEKNTLEDQRVRAEIESMTRQSKAIVNEAVCRSVVRAEEESERLRLAFQFRNEAVLRMLEADLANDRRDILALEQRRWSQLHELCIEEQRRVVRLLDIQRSFKSLLYHVSASEAGMRFNEEMDEERSWVDFLEQASHRRVVLDVVELAVSSSMRSGSSNA